MNEKPIRGTTPTGEAKWAHLVTPKAPFVDDQGHAKGSPKYQLDVVFKPSDPAWAVWADAVNKKVKALPVQIDKRSGEPMPKQNPLKRELDDNDQPTGRWYITFKTSDKFKPPVFDRAGRVLEGVQVGNGSKVKVSYVENTFAAFGGGINFYLNAVQVLELVESAARSAGAYGFEVVEDDPGDFAFGCNVPADEPPPEDTGLQEAVMEAEIRKIAKELGKAGQAFEVRLGTAKRHGTLRDLLTIYQEMAPAKVGA